MVYSKKHQIILAAVILFAVAISIAVTEKEVITGEITQQNTRLSGPSAGSGGIIPDPPEIHVSYCASSYKTKCDLRYAKFDSTLWSKTTIDKGIEYSTNNGTWDTDVGLSSQILLDGEKNPRITYYASYDPYYSLTRVKFTKFVGAGNGNCNGSNSWFCEWIDMVYPLQGYLLSYSRHITSHPIGSPQFAVYINENGVLELARGPGGGSQCGQYGDWICNLLIEGNVAKGISAGYDYGSSNKLQYSYIDNNGFLKVAHFVSTHNGNCGMGAIAGEVQCDVVDTGLTSDYTSITSIKVDKYEAPHVAYTSSTPDYSLKYATKINAGSGNCGPNNDWQCDIIKNSGYPKFPSLVVNDDEKMISYVASGGMLEIARYVGSGGNCGVGSAAGKWQCDQIDNGLNIDGGTSITTMRNGNPAIAYTAYNDGGGFNLKVARNVGSGGNCGVGSAAGKWQCDLVDWEAEKFYHPSIIAS